MKHANFCQVTFKDFLDIVIPGNYVLSYALLNDRVHLEFAIANTVFTTQKFYATIFEELKDKADNYTGPPLKYFFDMNFSGITSYRFFPTDKEINYFKTFKLYSKLIVQKSEKTRLDEAVGITEFDDRIITYDNDGGEIFIVNKVI